MDDVDAVQAQIARNMIQSGDWVSAQLDGVKYLEKSPLIYWMMAVSYQIFGPFDWAARIPISLSAILLCWLIARMAGWTVSPEAGLYAGLATATSAGLWLFTRILIPDVVLTLTIAFALWSFFRALEPDERHPRAWALAAWTSLGTGLLLKGLIAAIFPLGTALAYLLVTGLWRKRITWRKLSLFSGILVMLAVAAPWHVLATLRNPPYFDFTMHSGPGEYHGFFWFYFFNEHILRFLNLRYPRDYNTVPRPLFWLLHFAWFFPFSAFFIRAFRLKFRGPDRASRMRLLCLCWLLVVMGFFTFSTTQEYYSMPAYPAFAILIGSAMAEAGSKAWKFSTRTVAVVAAIAFIAIAALLFASRSYPAPGDISQALAKHTSDYTLALDHMGDLTISSFAYLRLPLAIAGLAVLIGSLSGWFFQGRRAALGLSAMMVLFYQAARLALIAFNPYLGSGQLADALNKAPAGHLIIDNPYYEMSTLFFYTNRPALILNGRLNNLEYGSYAPGAPDVFIGNDEFVAKWQSPELWYVASEDEKVERLVRLVGAASLHAIANSGGKTIYANRQLP